MTQKKDDNHWFIVVAIIIIILIAIAFSSANTTKFAEREEEIKRRNEEEKKLAAELAELESKKEIYVKHESINAFTEKYMADLCEKRYQQLIKVLIILLLISNGLIIWLVPSMKILDLFSWNAAAAVLLNLIAGIFFVNVTKAKEYLKGIAMNYIEFRVYENRDKNYFTKKVKFYKEEIEKITTEITVKSNHLDMVKEESTKLNVN